MLTNGQVYDFSISDEFQSHSTLTPPNAHRMKIIGKRFSGNGDTVIYVYSFNDYSSAFVTNPTPHLSYSYSSGTDSMRYSNLSGLANISFSMQPNDSCDSSRDSLYNSSQFCGAFVYEHTSCTACCFEGFSYDMIYGNGLGQLLYDYYFPANYAHNHFEVFYYKKGPFICGTPDTTGLYLGVASTLPVDILRIFPSPAYSEVFFSKKLQNSRVQVADILGNTILQINCFTGRTLDISGFQSGNYTLIIQDSGSIGSFKLIISRN